MNFYGVRSVHKLMSTSNENNNNQQREISEQDVEFSPPRPSSSDGTTMFPNMPSPWTLSPQYPSPSLLFYCIASLHRHHGNIHAIAASRGLIFTGSNSSRIRVWKQPDCMDAGHLKASSGEIRSILAHNNMLFSAHKDYKIRIWNFTLSHTLKFKKLATLPKKRSFLSFSPPSCTTLLHKDCVSCMAYYHSEGLLYTGSHDRTVKAWRVSSGKCVDTFLAHEDNVNSILVNQDDGCVFSCSSDGSVKIWRRVYKEDSHTLTMSLKFQPSPVNTMALSTSFNHCFLYSGCSDGMINFWEKERLCYRFNHGGFLQGHRFAVLCLATVGNLIFSGSEDTTIRVWRREEGSCYHECLSVLDGHRGPVRCLAACVEMDKLVMGLLVYSASLDQTFKVWRVKILPDDQSMCFNYSTSTDHHHQRQGRNKSTEFDMSPVLSPSWVEKKLEGTYFQ